PAHSRVEKTAVDNHLVHPQASLRKETASTPVLDNLLPAGETRNCWASSSYAQKSAVPRALTVSIL
ncbi:hypothetical protein ACR6D4_004276, partial [Pseudomonas aeruginosa]